MYQGDPPLSVVVAAKKRRSAEQHLHLAPDSKVVSQVPRREDILFRHEYCRSKLPDETPSQSEGFARFQHVDNPTHITASLSKLRNKRNGEYFGFVFWEGRLGVELTDTEESGSVLTDVQSADLRRILKTGDRIVLCGDVDVSDLETCEISKLLSLEECPRVVYFLRSATEGSSARRRIPRRQLDPKKPITISLLDSSEDESTENRPCVDTAGHGREALPVEATRLYDDGTIVSTPFGPGVVKCRPRQKLRTGWRENGNWDTTLQTVELTWGVVMIKHKLLIDLAGEVFCNFEVVNTGNEATSSATNGRSKRTLIRVTKADMYRLRPMQYFNDALMDVCINRLKEKMTQMQKSQVHIFNTYFFHLLKSGRENDLIRLLAKDYEISKKTFLFVPVCEATHWSLVVLCNLHIDFVAIKARVLSCIHEKNLQDIDGEAVFTEIRSSVADARQQKRRKHASEVRTFATEPISEKHKEKQNNLKICAGDHTKNEFKYETKSSTSCEHNLKYLEKLETPCILLLDSLQAHQAQSLFRKLRNIFSKIPFGENRVLRKLTAATLPGFSVQNLPRQKNGWDCGVFVSTYMEKLVEHIHEVNTTFHFVNTQGKKGNFFKHIRNGAELFTSRDIDAYRYELRKYLENMKRDMEAKMVSNEDDNPVTLEPGFHNGYYEVTV